MRDDKAIWVDSATGAGLKVGLGGRFLFLFEVGRKGASASQIGGRFLDLFGLGRNGASVSGIRERLRVFGEGGRQVDICPGSDSAFVDGFNAIDVFRGF